MLLTRPTFGEGNKMEVKIDYTKKRKQRLFVRMKMCDMNIQGKCCSYIGDLFIPDAKKRLSDAINNPNRKFLALTNVRVLENKEIRRIPFLLLNNDSIFSVEEMGDVSNGEEKLLSIC